MRRVVLLLGFIGAAVLVYIPIGDLVDARAAADQADLAAATNVVRRFAEATTDISGFDETLLSVGRAPEALAPDVRDRSVEASVSALLLPAGSPACTVVRVDGRVVASSGTDVAMIPASVQKLLTAVAVLDTIDPAERFATVLLAGSVVDGIVERDLHLVGGGDPMLAQQRYADAYSRQPQLLTPIVGFAELLTDAGITRVRGRIVVHDDRYDGTRYVESWPDRYLDESNAGPVGALTINDGFVEWEPQRVEANDPAVYAGQVLSSTLRAAGIGVDGGVRRASADELEALDEIAPTELGRLESAPVAEIVQQMLRESDNNTAESLLKELGYRAEGVGSTAAGSRVVEAAMAARGLDVSDLAVMDGSGLDRGNQVSCGLLAELLEQVGPASVVGEGMAVAGESGTLAHRFVGTEVSGRLYAKTGLLNNVNALAGYVQTLDGNIVTFAQLQNGVPLNSREGLNFQVELANELLGVAPGLTAAELVNLIDEIAD